MVYGWSSKSFRDQFGKDIASMAKGNRVQWVFNGGKMNRAKIKEEILKAMEDDKWRESIDNILSSREAQENLRVFMKEGISDIQKLRSALNDDNIFNNIFKIVD